MPGIIMVGTSPSFFFKVPVTRELVQCLQRGEYPVTPTVVLGHIPDIPRLNRRWSEDMKPLSSKLSSGLSSNQLVLYHDLLPLLHSLCILVSQPGNTILLQNLQARVRQLRCRHCDSVNISFDTQINKSPNTPFRTNSLFFYLAVKHEYDDVFALETPL